LGLKLFTTYDYKNKKGILTVFLHFILQNNMLLHIAFVHACIETNPHFLYKNNNLRIKLFRKRK
jgi:hypothetical protein